MTRHGRLNVHHNRQIAFEVHSGDSDDDEGVE